MRAESPSSRCPGAPQSRSGHIDVRGGDQLSSGSGSAAEEGGRDDQVAGDGRDHRREPVSELAVRYAAGTARTHDRADDAGCRHRERDGDVEAASGEQVRRQRKRGRGGDDRQRGADRQARRQSEADREGRDDQEPGRRSRCRRPTDSPASVSRGVQGRRPGRGDVCDTGDAEPPSPRQAQIWLGDCFPQDLLLRSGPLAIGWAARFRGGDVGRRCEPPVASGR